MPEFENCVSATGKGVFGVTPDKVTFHATIEKKFENKEELPEHMSALGAKCQEISNQLDQMIDQEQSSYQVLPSASSDTIYLRDKKGNSLVDEEGNRRTKEVHTVSYRMEFTLQTEAELDKLISVIHLLEQHQMDFDSISYGLMTNTKNHAHGVALTTAVKNAIHNCQVVASAIGFEIQSCPHQVTIGSKASAREYNSSSFNEKCMSLSAAASVSTSNTIVRKPKEIDVEAEVTVQMKIVPGPY